MMHADVASLAARRGARVAGLLVCILSVGSTGCRLTQLRGPFSADQPIAPQVIGAGATPAEIVAAVNQNSARVQTLTAPNATFTVPGLPNLPLLRGSIVLERPQRFRLKVSAPLVGDEVDLGSNEELFWFWAKRNEPPALYFARHDQAASPAVQQLLPVEPWWVVEALGIVTLDPLASYEGPLPSSGGNLELKSIINTPRGPLQRVTVVDPTRAWVVEQHVYDASGALVASSSAEDFRYHPAAGASLPEQVTIRVPTAGLALKINTGSVILNAPIANPAQHWALPNLEGYPQIDLGRSDGLPLVGAVAPPAGSQTSAPIAAPIAPPRLQLPPAVAARMVQRLPAGGVELPPLQVR